MWDNKFYALKVGMPYQPVSGEKMKKEIFIQLKPGSSTEFTDVSTDAKIPAQEARSEW